MSTEDREKNAATEQLSQQECVVLQNALLEFFKAVLELKNEGKPIPGVVTACSTTNKYNEPAYQTYSIDFSKEDYWKIHNASLTVKHSSRYDKRSQKNIPTVIVELHHNLDKHDVFIDDKYPKKGEFGRRTAHIVFETDNLTGIHKALRLLKRNKIGPRITSAELILRGSATIYADSNTPRYSGRQLSHQEAKDEIENLISLVSPADIQKEIATPAS